MSEHLRTAKIPCKERVRKYRVHKIGVFSEKKRVSEYAESNWPYWYFSFIAGHFSFLFVGLITFYRCQNLNRSKSITRLTAAAQE